MNLISIKNMLHRCSKGLPVKRINGWVLVPMHWRSTWNFSSGAYIHAVFSACRMLCIVLHSSRRCIHLGLHFSTQWII
jgi:hypothetical protein